MIRQLWCEESFFSSAYVTTSEPGKSASANSAAALVFFSSSNSATLGLHTPAAINLFSLILRMVRLSAIV